MLRYGPGEIPKPFIARAIMELPDEQLFAADKIAPLTPVGRMIGTVPIVKRDDMMRIESDELGLGAAFGRVELKVAGPTFNCSKKGREGAVLDEYFDLYGQAFDAELVVAKQCMSQMKLGREARLAKMLFNTGTWTGSTLFVDDTGENPWTNPEDDPLPALRDAKLNIQKNTGSIPNVLIANTENIERLLGNQTIGFRRAMTEVLDRATLLRILAAQLGITDIIEAGAVYNTAAEGQDMLGAFVWPSKYVMLARVCKTLDLTEPGLARTLRYDPARGLGAGEQAVGGEASQPPYIVILYRESQKTQNVIQVRHYTDEFIEGAGYANLIQVEANGS